MKRGAIGPFLRAVVFVTHYTVPAHKALGCLYSESFARSLLVIWRNSVEKEAQTIGKTSAGQKERGKIKGGLLGDRQTNGGG